MNHLGSMNFLLVGRAYMQAVASPDIRLALVREPDNQADPNAIGVWDPNIRQVGFVAADTAASLAPLMAAGLISLTNVCVAYPEEYQAGGLGNLELRADVNGDLDILFDGHDAAFEGAAGALKRVLGGESTGLVMDQIGVWTIEGEVCPEAVMFRVLVESATRSETEEMGRLAEQE